MLHHSLTISGEEIYPLNTPMISIMTSNVVDCL